MLCGEVAAKGQGARIGSRKLNARDELLVLSLVFDRPHIYLQEICEEAFAETRVAVSVSTVCRLLKRHGLTPKMIRKIEFTVLWGIHGRNIEVHK